MNFFSNLFYKIINFLIRSKTIITNFNDAKINFNCKKTLYLFHHKSRIDLLALRKKCLEKNLPDPLDMLNIKNKIISRSIFLLTKRNKLIDFKLKSDINFLLQNNDLDLKVCLISIFFGRSPDIITNSYTLNFLIILKKIFSLIFFKRNILIYFSKIISLKKIISNDKKIFIKLFRLANIYFIRENLMLSGPAQISKQHLFNKLIKIKRINKTLKNEIKTSNFNTKNNILKIIKEISSNFSYTNLYITEKVMHFILNKFYTKINIKGAKKIKKIIKQGNKIVYLPCHKSHMDYLLLSYIIYHQGLIPPHIIAGINLNFWPIGFIFKSLGAIFIKRNFKNNKIYTIIFKEYLIDLFNRGFSIEYFIEGRRSRTGKLLHPKTGTLSIIVKSILQNNIKSIVLMPIYIGYEHVIEEKSYIKELKGAIKKKEGLLQIFQSLLKIRNLGQVYINFGKPLYMVRYIKNYMNKNSALLRNFCINTITNELAIKIMTRINSACAINSINLCSVILLATKTKSLNRKDFICYLNSYIQILNNVRYSAEITIPTVNAEILLEHTLKIQKFVIYQKNNFIFLSKNRILLMHYYRNNICHILIIPSLITTIIYQNNKILKEDLFKIVNLIYPFIKNEFFLIWKKKEISLILDNILQELERQKIIIINDNIIYINLKKLKIIKNLSSIVQEFLTKYTIVFFILQKNSVINSIILKRKIFFIYKSIFKKSFLEEYFDKNYFFLLLNMLKKEGYLIKENKIIAENSKNIYDLLLKLIVNKEFKSIIKKI